MVGYKRVIVIAVIGTSVAILLDHFGLVGKIANLIPGGDW
jgi:hypothetical protein